MNQDWLSPKESFVPSVLVRTRGHRIKHLKFFLPIMTSSDHDRHHRFVSRKKLHPELRYLMTGISIHEFSSFNGFHFKDVKGKCLYSQMTKEERICYYGKM